MISLIIGGAPGSKDVNSLWPEDKTPQLLDATVTGSFKKFCDFALRSTDVIKTVSSKGETLHEKVADDDFAVHFSDSYINTNLGNGMALFKLTTALEAALDLNLDVEVIVLGSSLNKKLNNIWPKHWPPRQILEANESK